ncbi:MAG TPA: hypothetical protein ENL07_09925 [Chlorobaculum parvum]|uniref:Uncharacterized protein n=1 Tax=Chlorobaculum parvum TaxID=274539 RepID=A0A7C5DF90_9CHLB|nr:hypothetical protein [Chlorobaculum parvum]
MRLFQFLVTLVLCCTSLLLANVAKARLEADPAASKTPVKIFKYPLVKACADVEADLTLVQGKNGIVTITGTVTNVGKQDYMIDSVAEVIMNLSYAPQYSYAMTGVSKALVSKAFGMLKAGASIDINARYQIPDFISWASAGMKGNARRLFTLRVIKRDMSSYKAGEDCNAENNVIAKMVNYRAVKQ